MSFFVCSLFPGLYIWYTHHLEHSGFSASLKAGYQLYLVLDLSESAMFFVFPASLPPYTELGAPQYSHNTPYQLLYF